MTAPLFVFGTLRDPDVLALVLGRAGARTEPASLPGHAARTVAGRDYPVLVPEPGKAAPGALVHGLDAADRARLAWFEGEAYALAPCRVDAADGAVDATVFVAAGLPVDGPWHLDAWRARDKPGFLERARRWMDEFGAEAPAADGVVWGHGPDDDALQRGR